MHWETGRTSTMKLNCFLIFFLMLTIFAKDVLSQMFDWVSKGLKYWALSCSQPRNLAKKILSQKICVTSFLKKRNAVVRQETERVLMEKQPSEEFFKKGVMRNFAKFTIKTFVPEYLFWCFLVKFVKFVWTTFSQNSTRRLLLIIAASVEYWQRKLL